MQRLQNLPPQPGPLIGRAGEIAAISHLLRQPDVRLITVTGPGGVGKTRLAVQAAAELAGDFMDGVCFVSLASIDDPALVVVATAQALGLREAGGLEPFEQISAFLRDRQLLLLLDSFEHLLPAALLLPRLLAASPRLKVLVSSRTVLRLRGEYEFPLSPLSVPALQQPPAGGSLLDYDAVALFVQRAKERDPSFAITSQNARSVAELCVRLDGLPLALELAAARIRVLSVDAILERLEQRLYLLVGGAADLPVRQQTLRNAIGWSYDLLSSDEQRLFRRLAVFAGGCTLEAAAAVVGAEEGAGTKEGKHGDPRSSPSLNEIAILDGLESLLNQSLVNKVDNVRSSGMHDSRLAMLETIRAYGLEQLREEGETDAIRLRHATYYQSLAEQAELESSGERAESWLNRLEAEHDNLRGALRWLLDLHEFPFAVLLAGLLTRFWLLRGYLSEGLGWLSESLTGQCPPGMERAWARALNGAGMLCNYQGDYKRAEEFLRTSLALYRELGDKGSCAVVLRNLGQAVAVPGDYPSAILMYEEAVATLCQMDDRVGLAQVLWGYGNVLWMSDRHQGARGAFEEALLIYRELQDKSGATYCLMNLGILMVSEGDTAGAIQVQTAALSAMRDLSDSRGITRALYGLGLAALTAGDHEIALRHFRDGLALLRELGDRWFIANYLDCIASVATLTGAGEEAARIFGAVEALREAFHGQMAPTMRAPYSQHIAALRKQLDEGAFAAAWAAGRILSQEQAIVLALALAIAPPVSMLEPEHQGICGLTSRESEILRLLARGLTNRQIAAELVISPGTVHAHIVAIYSKLDVSTRSAATRYAFEHGLS